MRGSVLKGWYLPTCLPLGNTQVGIRGDFRQILMIMDYLTNGQLPRFIRWKKALDLFYEDPIPPELVEQAIEQLVAFITLGRRDEPGPKLIDWSFDADLISSQVNLVAGKELRQEEFVHWWTFMGYFDAIGPGLLSDVVAIRKKLATGKKLTKEEQVFYNANRQRIRFPDSPEIIKQKQYLEQLLKGGKSDNITDPSG